MNPSLSNHLDPDRWVKPTAPGAHEWWYFDAISDDGRDSLVVVWYSALPFDPEYGLASLRHIQNPVKHPKPDPLNHCAIGFSWYRDGKTVAYALNRFRNGQFSHTIDPQSGLNLAVHKNILTRTKDGSYKLVVDTPALSVGPGSKPIKAELSFKPASITDGWEKDLGTADHPHLWILAAPDCQVSGEIQVGKKNLSFQGRGYHDHNAGGDELSRSFHKWHWGRFHQGATTKIYYICEPSPGLSEGLWLECDQGKVTQTEILERLDGTDPKRTVFGIRYQDQLHHEGSQTKWKLGKPVDQGPFYLRWVGQMDSLEGEHGRGICELLQADHLHQRWFNWMIPYRLKQPKI
jgi:carotenoid 1,2-hydratase